MSKVRIIFIAAALALLAGCAKTMPTPGPEVSFRIARVRSVTKTDPADYKDAYSGVPFGAYAWYKDPTPGNDTVFMSNQKVSYDASNNRWAPEGTTYYWPLGGSLDFICYSPWSENAGPAVAENTIKYTSYDMRANPDTDLLYADKATGLTGNRTTYYYEGVPVLFRHALARLNFTMKLAYWEQTGPAGDKTKWEVTLNSITLKKLLVKGDLMLTLENGSWKKPTDNIWTPDTTFASRSFDCSGTDTFVDTAIQELLSGMLVMPQKLDAGQKLVLNLTIRTFRDEGQGYGTEPFIVENNVDIEAPIVADRLDRWGINNNITYNIVLSPSRIDGVPVPIEVTFDPAVDDWQNISINTEINI